MYNNDLKKIFTEYNSELLINLDLINVLYETHFAELSKEAIVCVCKVVACLGNKKTNSNWLMEPISWMNLDRNFVCDNIKKLKMALSGYKKQVRLSVGTLDGKVVLAAMTADSLRTRCAVASFLSRQNIRCYKYMETNKLGSFLKWSISLYNSGSLLSRTIYS